MLSLNYLKCPYKQGLSNTFRSLNVLNQLHYLLLYRVNTACPSQDNALTPCRREVAECRFIFLFEWRYPNARSATVAQISLIRAH